MMPAAVRTSTVARGAPSRYGAGLARHFLDDGLHKLGGPAPNGVRAVRKFAFNAHFPYCVHMTNYHHIPHLFGVEPSH